MRFRDIPPFTMAHYKVDVSLEEIEHTLASYQEQGLELEPDFQRGHVWTEKQQIRYIEYLLREGVSGRAIYFNQPGWMRDWHGDFVLVDGLQRLTACLRFLRNEIPAFGSYFCEYDGPPPLGARLEFYVNDLPTRAEVLDWYIQLNAGGVVHSDEEIARVRTLLDQERQSTE